MSWRVPRRVPSRRVLLFVPKSPPACYAVELGVEAVEKTISRQFYDRASFDQPI